MNSKKLFNMFLVLYSHYNTKTVFDWAAKLFKFDKFLEDGRMKKGPFWIKNWLKYLYYIQAIYWLEGSLFPQPCRKNEDTSWCSMRGKNRLPIFARFFWLLFAKREVCVHQKDRFCAQTFTCIMPECKDENLWVEEFEFPNSLIDHKIVEDGKIEDKKVKNGSVKN